jgi:hypothetical protein
MNTALARLRAKTDCELAVLIRRELQRSMALAARCQMIDATHGLNRAKAWMAVAQFSSTEQARLERLLESVQSSIEVPAAACA